MSNNFNHLHLHSHFSNGVTIPEVVNKPQDYINKIIETGGQAVCFTEHGNTLSWVMKKVLANKSGLKYIHGAEFYVTDSFEEKIRDNFHLVLLAKNYDGVQEINRMVSRSFKNRNDKNDNRFYYSPRISKDEVFSTSENILILTACLASPLWQYYKSNEMKKLDEWLEFIKQNKSRVWLEVQPHNNGEQIAYNKFLKEFALNNEIMVVATNDVHAVSEDDDKVRKLLMKSKGVNYSDEGDDSFECWFKDYSQMYQAFLRQGIWLDSEIEKILDEPNRIVDIIEDFEFDFSFKYPSIFPDNEKYFKSLIVEGYKNREINKLPSDKQKIYKDRINSELETFKNSNTIDYMLLINYVIDSARKENKFTGFGRGSVTGSLISFLLGVTDVDPIIEDLSFERFMNPDRVSLADIDTDISGVGEYSDRDWVADFLLNNENFNSTAIVTYNTLGLKGAIKDMGRALGYDPQEMNRLTSEIHEDEIPQNIRDKYSELIELSEKIVGVITSIGRHAAGFVVTTRDIESELGCISVSNSDAMISIVSMKEIDMLNYVKLDILGLDNIELINKTTEFAGIERATPNSKYINFNDQEVMDDLRKSTVGIFQFEKTRANKLIRDMFSPETQAKIAKSGIKTSPVSQLALLSAAMRPGAASIIDDVVMGEVFDNGHKALNDLLKDTLGYLIYQESQIEFLVQMCGRTKAQADIVRRSIGKLCLAL